MAHPIVVTPPAPRWRELAHEGLATAWAQPVASAISTLIMAAVCAVVFATTGQSAASEARVVSQVDRAGSRALTVSDPSGSAQFVASHLDRLDELAGVQWTLALSPALDVTNARLGDAGNTVSNRDYYTALPHPISVTSGRAPRPGEAIAGGRAAIALGLVDGVGAITDERGRLRPIVGTFAAQSPLASLDDYILTRSDDPRGPVQTLNVLARSIQDVPHLQSVLPLTVTSDEPNNLVIESPAALADLQRVLRGEVGRNSRRLMLLVLGTGLVLIAATQYGATAARRRDFGRRRALGATRAHVILLVLSQGLIAGLAGILLGTTVGLLLVRVLAGALPEWSFALGVAVLALLASVVAAAIPAILAARADPVRILRVP